MYKLMAYFGQQQDMQQTQLDIQGQKQDIHQQGEYLTHNIHFWKTVRTQMKCHLTQHSIMVSPVCLSSFFQECWPPQISE